MFVVDLHRRLNQPDQYETAITKKSFDGRYSRNSVIVTLSIGLGLYNSLELMLLIFTTFKRWRGLYFWSLLLCNTGIMLYSIGMMLMYFELCILWLSKVILDIGWLNMIICQSLVLYSRLNLILENLTLLRLIKWYIVINSSVLAITVIVLDFGTSYSGLASFARAYFYIEHVQLTGFTIQEVIISGVYVWKTIALLKIVSKARTRSMVWQLLVINVIIIAMDIVLIVLQFKHLQLYQESIKGFVYSVKLKLELNILSKLVDLVHGPSTKTRSMTLATIDAHTIIGQAQADIREEMDRPEFVTSWLGNDGDNKQSSFRSIVKQSEGSQSSHDSHLVDPKSSPAVSRLSEAESVSRVRSHTSTLSARLNGRECDVMYADMLRNISE